MNGSGNIVMLHVGRVFLNGPVVGLLNNIIKFTLMKRSQLVKICGQFSSNVVEFSHHVATKIPN